jgi:hypothetical protein
MAKAVEPDKTFDPITVGTFGPQAVMLKAEKIARVRSSSFFGLPGGGVGGTRFTGMPPFLLTPGFRGNRIIQIFSTEFSLDRMRLAVIYASLSLAATAVAAETPCDAPISRDDTREIIRLVRGVTAKPILFIKSVDEEKRVPGSIVTGRSYLLDVKSGKRTYQYTRTDLVSVYMRYTDRSHVDVYTVRKLHGRWKIEEKKDWFI